MSVWQEAIKEDIEVDGDELNIQFKNYYSEDTHYITVKIKDIKDLLNKNL